MVAGKRYVLCKFAKGGLRSQRVAVYGRPSIGNLAHYLVFHGFELLLLAFSAVWMLGLAVGLTVNDAWGLVPAVALTPIAIPFGPVDSLRSSLLAEASGELSSVMASMCLNMEGVATGLVNIIDDTQLSSGSQMAQLVYPPLPTYSPYGAFSIPALLNGFNITMEKISSIPTTALNLTCIDGSIDNGFSTGQLWYDGGDDKTLAIVTASPDSQTMYRLNASSIVMGGMLLSTSYGVEFALNGTTWPNVMSSNRWAKDIVTLVCNTSNPTGLCGPPGLSLYNFSIPINPIDPNDVYSPVSAEIIWSSVLGMAMGAYSSAAFPNTSVAPTFNVSVTYNDMLEFRARYGVYVLIANTVASTVMLVVVWLRLASRLSADLIDVTRLLLNPLKNAELFNATLETTVKARANPYMLVKEDSEFLLMDEAEVSAEKTRKRRTS